jgi:hypothetical protein
MIAREWSIRRATSRIESLYARSRSTRRSRREPMPAHDPDHGVWRALDGASVARQPGPDSNAATKEREC